MPYKTRLSPKERAELVHLETLKLKRQLRFFVAQAWPLVEPARFVPSWHIDAICEHLEAVARGDLRNLLINIPPRCSKSTLVSVMYSAWMWTHRPQYSFLYASYAASLSVRDSVKARRIIESPWYQARFGEVFQLQKDQNAKASYENDRGGHRLASSVGGVGTGQGGDAVVCLPYATPIATSAGLLPIGEIVEKKLKVRVLAYDHAQKATRWAQIDAYEKNPGRPLTRITLHDGTSLSATEEHGLFTCQRGYIPIKSALLGEEVLLADCPLLRVRPRGLPKAVSFGPIRSSPLQPGVSWQNADGLAQCCALYNLQGRHRAAAGACGAGWGQLLQPRVRGQGPNRGPQLEMGGRQGYNHMPAVREAKPGQQRQAPEILQPWVQGGLLEYAWLAPAKAQGPPGLPAMRRRLRAPALRCSKRLGAVLQSHVRQFVPPQSDRGDPKPALPNRAMDGLCQGFCRSLRPGAPARRGEVCRLPSGAPKGQGVARASHQPGQIRQPGDQFGDLVQLVPPENPRPRRGAIRAVEAGGCPEAVYNIRVRGFRNYFANGVLVHNCDDPHKVGESESETAREAVLTWWDGEMTSRGNNPKTLAKIIVMQRIHEQDLSGHVLAQGGYEHLCLPAEFEPARRCATSLPWRDPRQKEHELLCPERFGPAEVAELKLRMGSQRAAGQLQQRPAPAEGAIVKRDWWRFFAQRPPLESLSQVAISADLTFKDREQGDWVVFQVWGRRGADKFLLEQVRAQLEYTAQEQAFIRLCQKYPRAGAKWIEDAANGAALVSRCRRVIPGVIAVPVRSSKVARARAVSPQIEAGNVHLPDPTLEPWVQDYIEEWASFPSGAHDDCVDCTTLALGKFDEEPDISALVPLSFAKTGPLGASAPEPCRPAWLGGD